MINDIIKGKKSEKYFNFGRNYCCDIRYYRGSFTPALFHRIYVPTCTHCYL